MSSKLTPKPKPGRQLWGNYPTDREDACEPGDPLRTVVEAPTNRAAGELTGRFAFGDPRAHPLTAEAPKLAQQFPTGFLHQQTSPNTIRTIHRCKGEQEQPPMNSTGQRKTTTHGRHHRRPN